MAWVVFGCAALVLLGAWWVVALRNLFRAALSLGVVLLGVAVLFLALQAEFLAFAQILVYVGAVLTLVIFAIMLTSGTPGRAGGRTHRQQGPAALASLALFGILVVSTLPLTQSVTAPSGRAMDAALLGQQFVTALLLPFEVVSLVFIAAVVGAIALAAGPAGRPRS